MNHVKLTLQMIMTRLIKKFFTAMLITLPFITYSQKDCGHTGTGLIPLTDLGNAYYRGFQGGLYTAGSNDKPAQHQTDLIAAKAQLQPLDTAGKLSVNGKIVMIGVGASNPRTEFDEFMKKSNAFGNLNPALAFANTCIGGQGVQKMNDPADNYWKQATHTFDSLGLNAAQVQIAWIETENTQSADTVFPRAPQTLVNDLNQLLKTLLIKFPNLKICYFSPRAYSGYALPAQGGVGKGLLFPRDYYNGWAGKWLMQNIIDHAPGFEFSGPNKVIPLCTFGSYHWSDGDKRRKDSFYLDCTNDVGGDGLHLSEAGEAKIANALFDFFANDALAKQWFLSTPASDVFSVSKEKQFAVFPNPCSGDDISIKMNGIFADQKVNIMLIDITGRTIFESTSTTENSILNVNLQNIPKGLYWINIIVDGRLAGVEKMVRL